MAIRQLLFRSIAMSILPVDSKGALLVLLWSTMVFIYQIFINSYVINDNLLATISSKLIDIAPYALFYAMLPSYIFIGLVADICIGRYKIIVASIYFAFMGWIILCISFYITYEYVHFMLVAVGYLLATVGAAGVQSLAIPFNIDQTIGATADQLSAIVYWNCFGYPLGASLETALACLITDEAYLRGIGICVSGMAIIIVMVTYYLLRHHLDTTPLLTNPIKLIVKVLNYARKNKYPRLRNALTYWEESAPSRLDLGKDKYGGPFTEEEVEDVKTFFRLLPFVVCIFGYTAVIIVLPSINELDSTGNPVLNCMMQNRAIMSLIAVVMIVLYKIFFSRFCQKYIPSMIKRIGIGFCLLLFCTTVLLAMDLKDYNAATNCTLKSTVYDATNINYTLILVFEVICSSGTIIAILILLELAVAQSPSHMRGIIVSMIFAAGGVFSFLTYAIYLPHRLIHSHCALYYHVTVCVCVIVTISVYGVLAKCYKLRTRNEVINIHHIVATVYERYIDQSEQYGQVHY